MRGANPISKTASPAGLASLAAGRLPFGEIFMA